jgi:CRP-like cAMP-binding protein
MSVDQLAGHLRTIDFLAGLDPKQIDVVAQGARVEQFLSGERVVQQDEPGDELYIILSGRADVQIEQNGLHSVVNHLSPGQFFGEMSLLTGEPRSATVVATSCLRVIVVGKESLIRVAKEDHRVIEQIGETVARRHASMAAAKRQLSQDAAMAAGLMQARSLIERIQNFFWG